MVVVEVELDVVRTTSPLTSVRPAPLVEPALADGSFAEATAPDANDVNAVALPMVVPPGVRNEIVPVHEAAVPLEELDATFTTSISAVSVVPNGTNCVEECGIALEEAANAPNIPGKMIKVKAKIRIDMVDGRSRPRVRFVRRARIYVLNVTAAAARAAKREALPLPAKGMNVPGVLGVLRVRFQLLA